MSLVQKLPIGLGLACLMMMSSCSKEDALAPQQEMSKENSDANARNGVIVKLPYAPPTIGSVGLDIYPEHWGRKVYPSSPSLSSLPTGTSTLTHLWGDQAQEWETPLPSIPFVNDVNSILTVTTKTNDFEDNYKQAIVETKISNLEPNNTYTLEYYVATTKPKGSLDGYATGTSVGAFGPSAYNFNYQDLSLIPGLWKKATLVFQATSTESILIFKAISNGKKAYAHIYIDKHSIKKKQY